MGPGTTPPLRSRGSLPSADFSTAAAGKLLGFSDTRLSGGGGSGGSGGSGSERTASRAERAK